MRLTDRELRRIVREAYAGMLEPVTSGVDLYSPQQNTPGHKAKFDKEPTLRWVTSKRFDNLAERYYSTLPFNVWLAPYVGAIRGVAVRDGWQTIVDNPEAAGAGFSLGGRRLGSFDIASGVEKLQSLGYSGTENISSNDLVILFNVSTTRKRILSTPWMIIHSLFDSSGEIDRFCPSWNILRDLMNYETDDPALEILGSEVLDIPDWLPALTMGSARDGEIENTIDTWAEVCTQDLITRSGVVFDYSAVSEEEAEALRRIIPVIKQISAEFEASAPGNLIYVDVS